MTRNRPDDRPVRLLALDCESTGLHLADGNAMIEIGAAFRADDGNIQIFEAPIYHRPGSFTWEAKAFEVNHYTLDQISDDTATQPADIVDARLANWIVDQCGDSHRLVLLGWNVGSFDWPFVLKYLPITASLFVDRYGNPAHQFADLNSMMFLIGSITDDGPSRADLTRAAEERAEVDGLEVRWHSGGFDSYGAIIAFETIAGSIRS